MDIVRIQDPNYEELFRIFFNSVELDVRHSKLSRKFYSELDATKAFNDCSFIVSHEGLPLCAVFITVHVETSNIVSCYNIPCAYYEIEGLYGKKKRQLGKTIKEEFLRIIDARELISLSFEERSESLSIMGTTLLEQGFTPNITFVQIIDLTKSEEKLWSELRKGYKSSVTWAKKNMSIALYDHQAITSDIYESFRNLHIAAAGRETRSVETWKTQMDMVHNKEAFVIVGTMGDEVVTAALFLYNKEKCFYGVSASHPNMSNKPLSHIILWNAIVHSGSLGCDYFEIGEQLFDGQLIDGKAPSNKELSLSFFKKGFGGRTYIKTRITT